MSLSLLLTITFDTFGPEALVVPRSEVLREAQHCDVEMKLHSDRTQAVGCDMHFGRLNESLARLSVKFGSLEEQNMRTVRRRVAVASHRMIFEGNMEAVKRHMQVGLTCKNFVRSRRVGLGKHLAMSRVGWGMVGCWAKLGAGVPLNGKAAQTQPLLHPTETVRP